jgi:NTE family protein
LDRLIADSAISEYAKGTVLFRESEACNAIFLIISGRCETRTNGLNGSSHVEEVFGPGDTLGERAFLNHEPHRHSAIVLTHAVLLRIPDSELQGLFAKDPYFAGRFSQVVVGAPRPTQARRVRRLVSVLSLSPRLDADVAVRQLAASLHRLTHQRVLVLNLGPGRSKVRAADWRTHQAGLGAEFCFTRHLQTYEGGFAELRITASAEPRDACSIPSLLSHCARHFDFVLLHLHADTPVPTTVAGLLEADLSFVLLQASMQNLYDFELLTRALGNRAAGHASPIKPILCAEESIAAPEVHAALKKLGHPLHSFCRGFPLRDGIAAPDHRFDLLINRLAREIARRRIGLALSSGAAKGLAHIGVIQVLEENGIEVDCIAGSSMGAYIGSIWAYGLDGTKLEKLARELEGRWGLLRVLDPSLPPRRGFLHTRRTVARLRRSIGAAHFSELVRPLRILATHLDTLERVVFSSGEVASAVEASIAIPGICVPVTMEGETYIDGGISDPLPVDVLEEMGIERIIAVNVIPPPERIRQWHDCRNEPSGRAPHRSILGSFFRDHFNYLAHGNILDTMMQAISGAQTRVAEAAAREADIVLRPLDGDAEWHDFTHPQKYIALGRAAAEAQLAGLKALAGANAYERELPPAHPAALAA